MELEYEEEDFLSEVERKAKQNFLREEILDMHYDPNLFTHFCESKKTADIDCWEFDELQECVREFKLKYRPGETLEDLIEQKKKEEEKEKKITTPFFSKKLTDPEESKQPEIHRKTVKKNIEERKVEEKPRNRAGDIIDPLGSFSSERRNIMVEKPAQEVPKQKEAKSESPKLQTPSSTTQKNLPPKSQEAIKAENKPEPKEISIKTEPVLEERKEIPSENYQNEVYEISVKSIPPNEISECKTLEVTITQVEVVQGGFLTSDYVEYDVCTLPFKWHVKRRYRDFYWLRQMLCFAFPGIYIAPIPHKKARGNLKETTIFKRKKFLNQYISALIRNPLTRRSEYFLRFLKEDNQEVFNNYKEQCKALLNPAESLPEIVSITGKVTCDLSDKTKSIDQIKKYITYAEALKKRLKKQELNLRNSLIQVSESLNSYNELIKQMEAIQDILPCNKPNKEAYSSIQKSLLDLSAQHLEKAKNVKEYFGMHFSYFYDELNAIKDLIKDRDARFSEYKRIELKNLGNENGLKNIYAYLNHQVTEEVERVAIDNVLLNNIHFWEMARKEADDTIQYHLIWGTLMVKLAEARKTIPPRPYITVKK
ncbi:unnamed protein product [Blepharisma stoltei]|uniref:PX domain-containing protein n=1 Tax=Blepharisma stoltei TaxID=1481888 RepID=A0AAU9JDV1_9CILI|nr:unnamed protein product [Blepharisma stoltei]